MDAPVPDFHPDSAARADSSLREDLDTSFALMEALSRQAHALEQRVAALDARVIAVLDHAAFVHVENLEPGAPGIHNVIRLTMVDPVGHAWHHEGTLAEVITAAYNELPLEG